MKYTASLACSRLLHMADDISDLVRADITIMHIDIMDGHNVPNLCLSIDHIKHINKEFPSCIQDVHLMVDNPTQYIERVASAGGSIVSASFSAVGDIDSFLRTAKKCGIKAGFILNPDDSFEEIKPYLEGIDLITVMSIKPGIHGQVFMEDTFQKIRDIASYKESMNLYFDISVDGGINVEKSNQCKEAGATMVVLGLFAVFGQEKSVYEASKDFIALTK